MNVYLKRVLSNRNYRIALLILVIFVVWLASGQGPAATSGDDGSAKHPTGVTSVKARDIVAQDFAPQINVRAHTEAERRVELRAETAGRVIALPVAEGQAVKQGDTLCELAVDDRQLRYVEARSAVELAQLEYDASQKLRLGGHQSQTALAAAKSRLDTAKANLGSREIDLANTKIKAPFAGVVERQAIKVGGYMDRGSLCAVMLDLDPILLVGQVSESEVGRLQEGQNATAQLLQGEKISARLRYIASETTGATRTFKVEASSPNPDYVLRSGLTVELALPLTPVRAHSIPSSLLALDDEGKLGVRILNKQNVVQFHNVQLLGDSNDGVWVLGLPEQTRLITVGQEYVSSGSTVEVVLDSNPVSRTAPDSATLTGQGEQ